MYIDDDMKPVFYEESRSDKEITQLVDEHNVIFSYFMDVIDILPSNEKYRSSVMLCDAILGLLAKEWSEFEESNIFSVNNVDEFMGRVTQLMNR